MVSDEPGYARPFVTVDVAILTLREASLQVLLMRRATPPFAGEWALPGGYIHPEEDADLRAAAGRILREKAGIATPYLEQLQAYGDARRDPRGWTASFAWFALISSDALVLREGGNADDVAWSPVATVPALAFDHTVILRDAVARLRSKLAYTTLAAHLLPDRFTLTDLQRVYEQILGRNLDKSAFRKRMAEADFLAAIPGARRAASNRPAQLYCLKPGGTVYFDRLL